MARRVGWIVMTLSAVLMVLVSSRYFFPDMPGAFEQQRALYFDIRPWLMAHIAGGMIAVLLGPWQFWTWFRTRHLKWHRRIGKGYLIGVAIGAPAALYLALHSHGGMVTHVGFGLMALVWAGTSFTAFQRIRGKRIDAHREWMTRSYAVTLGFVMLRVWIPTFGALGVPFDEAYQTISWLCWVPNLLIAEMYLGWRRQQRAATVQPT
jgi:hypothetical protein